VKFLNDSLLLFLRLAPILVLIVALIEPSAALPIFVALIVLSPLIIIKFVQQAMSDLGRELYSTQKETVNFNSWDYVHFDWDEDEAEIDSEPIPEEARSHLSMLRLSYPYTEEELNRAYRRRARETHPDVPGGSEYLFIRVREAYEALKQQLPKDEGRSMKDE